MTTITIDETPSKQAVAKASAEVNVTDSAGREITLKKPGILSQYRLVEVAGESAKNDVYMRMILPLIFVTAIAGDAVLQPTTKLQLEALITRLDDHGIEAIMKGVADSFGASDPEADKAAIKK